MGKDIGWKFPPSGGGSIDGFNDAGIETFAGTPYMSLAREVIQNSLDARRSPDEPVTVTFEKVDISPADLPGRDELLWAFGSCRGQARTTNMKKAMAFFDRGTKLLESDEKISCLKIRDSNTTGLRGEENDSKGQWCAIVKGRGITAHKDMGAGGAFGIGKSAPYAVSDLRTVFYYTHYFDKKGAGRERAQGKAILTSHSDRDGENTQGTGFYGIKDGCMAINAIGKGGGKIPKFLRRELRGEKDQGTTLLVAGISEPRSKKWEWHDEVIAAVIANYFYAINNRTLEVDVENGDHLQCINPSELPKLLSDKKYHDIEDAVASAQAFYRAMCEGKMADKTLPKLKHCRLWICKKEDLPRKVAIVRQTGMLITDKLRGLIQWPGCNEFAAVCACLNNEGNELLRGMENPAHNDFEPSRLKENEATGRLALSQLTKWVREAVKAETSIVEPQANEIKELADLIPDQDPEESLPGEGADRDFEGKATWSLKPIQHRTTLPPLLGEEIDTKGGFGSGEGSGGNSRRTRGRASRGTMEITGVRILPDAADGRRKRVMFTPLETGCGRLSVSVAGDNFVENLAIADVDLGTKRGSSLELEVEKGKRVTLEVTLAEPIDDALALVFAKKDNAKERSK